MYKGKQENAVTATHGNGRPAIFVWLRHMDTWSGSDKNRNSKGASYILLYLRRSEEIRSLCDRFELYRIDWTDHMLRMPDNGCAGTVWNYKPRGHRTVGKPRKRWWEQIYWSWNGPKWA